MRRLLSIACVLVAVLAAVACGSKESASTGAETTAPAGGEPRNLATIDELRSAFNAKSAEPRLILIISPT